MKIKMLFVAMAIFAFASISHAQFNAGLYNFGPNLLMNSCTGGEPLGPDCVAQIYWDANNNGPDASDQQPVVGDAFGQANFNSFTLQSGYDFGFPGGFYIDPLFTISTVTPLPSRYYVVVNCQGVKWTSPAFTILTGPPTDYDLGAMNWTCETTVVPCDQPTFVGIQLPAGGQTPVPFSQCIPLCAGAVTQICLGPLYANHRPHGHVTPGCMTDGCQTECPPAQFGYDDAGWTYNAANGTWCNFIVPGSDGCVCFTIDFIEGVVDVDFSATAGDSKVDLLWNTGAESDMAGYNVMRRVVGHEFSKLATIDASNSSSGSTYTYTDESADNGTAYEYTLQMVALNGDVTELGTISPEMRPSTNLAVITEYALHQNYPNPFNPSTSLVFDVVAENVVNLKVYNAMGQEVATLVNGTMNAGRHTVNFDATNLTSGLYFYTVKIGNEFTATKKMLLVK
ncbi:MAG: T9SS type A sorting domain-containing protein [bacterium]|nr:T9SS type A sorting domain-containing protein [bacterium]